jgi:hypothetical protein
MEWELSGETEVLGKNLPQWHFLQNKSNMTWSRIKLGPTNRLGYSMATCIQTIWKYEGKSKIIRTFVFPIYLHTSRGWTCMSFFYIVSFLFDALGPAVHKLRIPSTKKVFGWSRNHLCTASRLGVWCELLASDCWPENHCSLHCWSYTPFPGGLPV